MVSASHLVDTKTNAFGRISTQSIVTGHSISGGAMAKMSHFVGATDRDAGSTVELHESMLERSMLGESVACLAKAFQMSKTAIHTALMEARVQRLMAANVDYIDSDEFRQRNADSTICGSPPEVDDATVGRIPTGLPAYLGELYRVPLLTKCRNSTISAG